MWLGRGYSAGMLGTNSPQRPSWPGNPPQRVKAEWYQGQRPGPGRRPGPSRRLLCRPWEWGGLLCRLWERGGLLQLRPAAGEREHLAGGGRAPFLRHCLDRLRFLWLRCHEPGRRRVRWFGLGLGPGLVHRLGRGRRARPEQLVLRLPGPSPVPALATIDDAVGPVAARDTLWLALGEVAAARDVNQRARNQQCDQNPSGSAPPHAVRVAGERGSIGAAASGVLREIHAPQAPGALTLFRRAFISHSANFSPPLARPAGA